MTEWEVLLVEEVADWFVDLTKNYPASADLIEDAIDRLAAVGPGLERPLVDVRRAVLVVAGDKSGNWKGWYERAIPLADKRHDAHLAELDARGYQ